MEAYEIEIDKTKEYKGYDDAIDATAFNVFGAAAFRFGHSLVPVCSNYSVKYLKIKIAFYFK